MKNIIIIFAFVLTSGALVRSQNNENGYFYNGDEDYTYCLVKINGDWTGQFFNETVCELTTYKNHTFHITLKQNNKQSKYKKCFFLTFDKFVELVSTDPLWTRMYDRCIFVFTADIFEQRRLSWWWRSLILMLIAFITSGFVIYFFRRRLDYITKHRQYVDRIRFRFRPGTDPLVNETTVLT